MRNDGVLAISDVDKTKIGKFIMKSFWTQSLDGIRIGCLKQVELAAYLA